VIVSAVTMLTLMWVVFRIAAGPYYETYRALAASVVSTSDQKRGLGLGGDEAVGIREQIITFRRGFVHSAGATNLASSSLPQTTPLDIARDTAVGTAAMLVPISLLQALSVVDLRGGGRGLMWFTDLDTLFLEVSLAAALFLVIRNRSRFWQDPTGVVFMVVLSVATGLLAAYIVTNFGTLFRLRMLAVVPAWLLPLASAATSSRAAAQEKSGSLSAVG
jgi:hypothetical protein